MKKILLPLLLLFTTITYANPPTWYQVELIAFKHINSESMASESWPNDPHLPDIQNSIELQQDDSPIQAVQSLPPEFFELVKEEKTITENLGYEILNHLAWRQPLSAPRFAVPVHIFGGNELRGSHGIPKLIHSSENVAPSKNIRDWEFNGTITLSKEKFINLQTNLVLNEPTNSLPGESFGGFFGGQPLKSFRLMQSRRLRNGELHYFDHPLFGLLVKVTPLQKV